MAQAMDHKGLIDFNKYTLALAAGGFIYTLSTFVPVSEEGDRIGVLVLLGFFLISMILGILVYAAATASLHGDAARENRLKRPISWMGGSHAIFLVLGLSFLGFKLYSLVMSPPNIVVSKATATSCTLELSDDSRLNVSLVGEESVCRQNDVVHELKSLNKKFEFISNRFVAIDFNHQHTVQNSNIGEIRDYLKIVSSDLSAIKEVNLSLAKHLSLDRCQDCQVAIINIQEVVTNIDNKLNGAIQNGLLKEDLLKISTDLSYIKKLQYQLSRRNGFGRIKTFFVGYDPVYSEKIDLSSGAISSANK